MLRQGIVPFTRLLCVASVLRKLIGGSWQFLNIGILFCLTLAQGIQKERERFCDFLLPCVHARTRNGLAVRHHAQSDSMNACIALFMLRIDSGPVLFSSLGIIV